MTNNNLALLNKRISLFRLQKENGNMTACPFMLIYVQDTLVRHNNLLHFLLVAWHPSQGIVLTRCSLIFTRQKINPCFHLTLGKNVTQHPKYVILEPEAWFVLLYLIKYKSKIIQLFLITAKRKHKLLYEVCDWDYNQCLFLAFCWLWSSWMWQYSWLQKPPADYGVTTWEKHSA